MKMMMILIVAWMKGMMKDLDRYIVIPSSILYLRSQPCMFRWFSQIGKQTYTCMQGRYLITYDLSRNTIRFEDSVSHDNGDLVRIGQSYTAVWVKIVSGWICHVIYIWSMVAPVLMPDRFDVRLFLYTTFMSD